MGNKKLYGNTTPEGQSVFIQFRVFPTSTSVDIIVYQYGKNVLFALLYSNVKSPKDTKSFRVNKWREIFRVYIELCKHDS